MPVMSRVEQAFCRSAPWRAFTRRTVVPWASRGHILHGEVLELGSGSGAIAADLVDRYPITHLVATDVDPRMVASAGRRLARYVPRVDVRRVDATALPFPDASFDVVASFLMLHHVIDWEQALAEVVRVLRPGGMFVGYDLVDTAPARLLHRLGAFERAQEERGDQTAEPAHGVEGIRDQRCPRAEPRTSGFAGPQHRMGVAHDR